MVIIHIANIDSAVLGGVQIAVPQMVRAQAEYATVGMINTYGADIDGIRMLEYHGKLELTQFPAPFNRPDLVVFHEVYRFEFIGIYKALLKAGVPYIIIPHGCLSRQAQRRKWLKKFAANILLFHAFIRSAQFVQYLSESESRMSAFPRFPAFVCGNGICLPQKRKTDFFREGIKFVYIGRLEIRTKGLDLLLAAIEICSTQLREAGARFEVYGPDYGGEHAILQAKAQELGITDLVRFGREKTGEEKKRILLSSDCFIQTSRTEGLPLGPLEALGYGLPCIVTEGVGLGELIESNGAGYRCQTTAEGIVDGIRRFLAERDRVQMLSEAAAKVAKENFDRDLIAERTVKKYCNILQIPK